ncbi:hypothetical protein FRX31_030391 [Thalictrum thalictroides]|uniref:Uncharacterized protein n=1 Tax=Thalictrum thalictroides TaxID=46969 RepID=A0A7J6V6I3_THATH|nr:hypothetical protein FRX31_030391 [Thalictrum thalictroides]
MADTVPTIGTPDSGVPISPEKVFHHPQHSHGPDQDANSAPGEQQAKSHTLAWDKGSQDLRTAAERVLAALKTPEALAPVAPITTASWATVVARAQTPQGTKNDLFPELTRAKADYWMGQTQVKSLPRSRVAHAMRFSYAHWPAPAVLEFFPAIMAAIRLTCLPISQKYSRLLDHHDGDTKGYFDSGLIHPQHLAEMPLTPVQSPNLGGYGCTTGGTDNGPVPLRRGAAILL